MVFRLWSSYHPELIFNHISLNCGGVYDHRTATGLSTMDRGRHGHVPC